VNNLSKVELLKQSWAIVKKNYVLIALLVLAFFVFSFIQGIVGGFVEDSPILSLIISLLFSALSLFLEIGFIKIVLKLVDGHKATIQELWAYPQYFVNMVIASIIYVLIILGGLILLVIPGIYLAIRLQFYSYAIVDKNAKPIDALKMSWKWTEGNAINLILFMLLLVALNIAGALVFLVGLLVTIPVSFVAVTLLYRKLSS
jgi:uncharacterized membrane protein